MKKNIFIILILLMLSACKEQIMHDLDESDANRMLARLHETNIPSQKVKQANGQWAISVDKSDSIKAIKYLSDARMFKNNEGAQQQKSSLVSSKEDQKFFFERAVSHELEKTLLGMPSVLDARVHLNLPSSDPIFGNRLPDAKGTGSVLLVVAEDFSGNMSQISELIAGAAGIEKSAISILVSRDMAKTAINTAQAPAEPVPAAVLKSDTSEVNFSAGFSRNYFYISLGILMSVALAIGLIKKTFKRKTKVRSRELGEEDLYELARDFN